MTTATSSDVVVSWQTASTPYGDISRGQKYRRDDQRVVEYPEFFREADTPEEELPTTFHMLDQQRHENEMDRQRLEREAFERDAKLNPTTLTAPDVVKCTKDHPARLHGRPVTIRKGSTALASDPVTHEAPELWRAA